MKARAKTAVEIHEMREFRSNGIVDLDQGFNARRLRANLLRNVVAMAALSDLGLEAAFVQRLGFGIKEPYVTVGGLEVRGVLTYPLDVAGGRSRYGYLNLPSVTVNPDHPEAWSPGEPRSVRFGSKGVLLVLSTPTALFQARFAIERRGVDISVVASSQADRMPREWLDPSFWAVWDRVILDDLLPGTIRVAVVDVARRPIEVAKGVALNRSRSLSIVARLDDWIDDLVSEARPLVVAPAIDEEGVVDRPGDYAATPISLHGGVVGGRMYYPFLIERRRRPGGKGEALTCSYETMVVRSDGAVLEARTLPAPRGVQTHQLVHCLTDGTRISSPPSPSRIATWSFDAIQAFVACRTGERQMRERPAAEVISDVHALLSAHVVLPETSDLWVATAFVVLTHMFRVFDAIPLLLIEGPHGSGKSELASVLSSLGFNAVTMGQGSAAALVRVAQDCGGLVVLDDVEGLSAGNAGFGELSQCLKVGYRALTAKKPITLGSGRIETFDFFGPRIVTCTRGVEPVLRSRCIVIATAPASAASVSSEIDSAQLRDELHGLGMAHVASIAAIYDGVISGIDDRADEIWAPLLAIMDVLGPAAGADALRHARERHVG